MEDLDISWSDLKPKHYKEFWETLRDNKTLKNLNLSYNLLIDHRDQNEPVDMNEVGRKKTTWEKLLSYRIKKKAAKLGHLE